MANHPLRSQNRLFLDFTRGEIHEQPPNRLLGQLLRGFRVDRWL